MSHLGGDARPLAPGLPDKAPQAISTLLPRGWGVILRNRSLTASIISPTARYPFEFGLIAGPEITHG